MRPSGVVDGKTVNIPLPDLELHKEGQNRYSQPLIGLRCKYVGGVVGKSAAHNTEVRMRGACPGSEMSHVLKKSFVC